MKARLITWEHIGDHANPRGKRVIALLNPRWSPERVRSHVEALYSAMTYSAPEQLRLLKRDAEVPYPARFAETTGRITCGHNPWLYARLVDDVQAIGVSEAVERVKSDPRALSKVRPSTRSLRSLAQDEVKLLVAERKRLILSKRALRARRRTH